MKIKKQGKNTKAKRKKHTDTLKSKGKETKTQKRESEHNDVFSQAVLTGITTL